MRTRRTQLGARTHGGLVEDLAGVAARVGPRLDDLVREDVLLEVELRLDELADHLLERLELLEHDHRRFLCTHEGLHHGGNGELRGAGAGVAGDGVMGTWAYELARCAVVHGGVCSRDPVGAWWAGRRRLLPADAVDQLHDERVGFVCADDKQTYNELHQLRAAR